MSEYRILKSFDDTKRAVGETFDLIGLDDTQQRYRVTKVEPLTVLGVPGWVEEAEPIGPPRPVRWPEKFWSYWSPWKPWCWLRRFGLLPRGW